MRIITENELKEIMEKNRLWVNGEKGGKRANLDRAILTGANLNRANLDRAILTGANLDRAILTGANLDRAILTGAILTGANLDRANLDRANLDRAILTGAILTGAILNRANLDRANLDRANLDRAILTRANLTRANLTGAILTGANLNRANLDRANLDRAILTGAILTGVDLTRAEGLTKIMGVEPGNIYWKRFEKGLNNNTYQFKVGLNTLRDGEVFASDERITCSYPGFHFASRSWCTVNYPDRPLEAKIRVPADARINEPWATDGKSSADMIEIIQVFDVKTGEDVTDQYR